MSEVTYEIVEHDGGWAYKVGGVFSEPFPTHAAALKAAQAAAVEQKTPGQTEEIEYEDEKGKWNGHINNAKDGKTYESSIKLSSPNQLKVEGCVLGFLCGGETWTRVPEPVTPMAANPATPHTGAPHTGTKATGNVPRTIGQKAPAPMPGAAATTPPAPGSVSDICLLPDVAGAAH